jgi:hypothetical protein
LTIIRIAERDGHASTVSTRVLDGYRERLAAGWDEFPEASASAAVAQQAEPAVSTLISTPDLD